MVKLSREEKELMESIERGEWRSVKSDAKFKRYREMARATLRKDKRVNIRLTRLDLEALQKRALQEGIPYQTLMASILHKYADGQLAEKRV